MESVVISSDGELIISVSEDKTVRRWRLSTGEAIGEPLRDHVYGIDSVVLRGDDKYIVSASNDGEIRMYCRML